MKKGEKQSKSAQILTFSIEDVEIPQFVERSYSGKEWFYWGKDNKLPFYLYGLYEKSSLMQSIINTTVNFIIGNSIESQYKPNEDETWEDLVRNLALDYMIYGGFALQVMYNKLGQIKELGWLDMRKCRSDEEHRKVYYSKEFATKSSPSFITFPIWRKERRIQKLLCCFLLYRKQKKCISNAKIQWFCPCNRDQYQDRQLPFERDQK